jgi:tRNA pseudouridine55 synthase
LNGLLLIDKPTGPSSHDAVARVRRALGERRIGHAGTLDPAASGLLLLLVGQATRLARFMIAGTKEYEAEIQLGRSTDTHDAEGEPTGSPHAGPWPDRGEVERALDAFRGTFLQSPPTFSAKKVHGRRSYRAARAARRSGMPEPVDRPAPVAVTVEHLEITALDGHRLSVRLRSSPGFYVRALAHDLGVRLGTGAHLSGLRRTRSGEWAVDDALALGEVERDPDAARRAVVAPARMLEGLPAVVLTEAGARRALHGVDLGPSDTDPQGGARPGALPLAVRLLTARGDLLGVGEPAAAPGLLHPSIVLG